MKILPYKLKNIELLILSLFSTDICFHSYFYSETTYGFVLFFPLRIFNRKYIISCYATNLSSQNRDCLGRIFLSLLYWIFSFMYKFIFYQKPIQEKKKKVGIYYTLTWIKLLKINCYVISYNKLMEFKLKN